MGIGYRELADVLRAAIESGEYAPGSTLPKQDDLAVDYGVHVTTVRKAINALQTEGLVTAIRRRGTVVRDKPAIQHMTTDRYAKHNWIFGGIVDAVPGRTSTGHPIAPTLHAHTVRFVGANDQTAQALDINPGNQVLQRTHVISQAGAITHTVTSYYRRDDVTGTPLEDTRPESASLASAFQVLTLRGLEPERIVETFHAQMPSTAERTLLHLQAGEPIIEIQRTTYAKGDRPVEFAQGIHAASRFEWSYEFAIPD